MTFIYTAVQGSAEWLEARRGVCTGSRFKDARARLKKGGMSDDCISYAMDLARERCGGTVAPIFQNAAMRTGSEQEPIARNAYETRIGRAVEETGFWCTDDRMFGASPDGLVGTDGLIEIKTMVSSKTLFKAVVQRDLSDYLDQINGQMWILGRKWCDLILWAPDLADIGRDLTVIRINRDERDIEALETDLLEFSALVSQYERALRALAA